MMDNKSTELMGLFEKDHQLDKTSPRLVSMYRMKAEEILGSDENVYRIGYVGSCSFSYMHASFERAAYS